MDVFTKDIIENYKRFDEDNRLTSPNGILEEEHTIKDLAKKERL